MGTAGRNAGFRAAYGPWALVTGASEGIGRAMAVEVARRGLDLVLVARRVDRLEALSVELARAYGVTARVVAADLAEPGAAARVVAATTALDVGLLVAAAGFGTSGRLVDTALADEVAMVDVNCRAVLALTKPFAEQLARRGRGGIVLLSSIVAFQGAPYSANYAATKAYVQTLAEGLDRELSPAGVDVVACAPGPVRTGFAARAGLTMGGAESAETVARETLDALGRRGTVRPGLRAKLLAGGLATLPRAARTVIMGRIMAGMATRRDAGQT